MCAGRACIYGDVVHKRRGPAGGHVSATDSSMHCVQASTGGIPLAPPLRRSQLLLVASHYTPDATAAPTAAATAAGLPTSGAPAAAAEATGTPQQHAAAPKPLQAKACFDAYFLPYSPTLDVREGQCVWESWVKRRLKDSRTRGMVGQRGRVGRGEGPWSTDATTYGGG